MYLCLVASAHQIRYFHLYLYCGDSPIFYLLSSIFVSCQIGKYIIHNETNCLEMAFLRTSCDYIMYGKEKKIDVVVLEFIDTIIN